MKTYILITESDEYFTTANNIDEIRKNKDFNKILSQEDYLDKILNNKIKLYELDCAVATYRKFNPITCIN